MYTLERFGLLPIPSLNGVQRPLGGGDGPQIVELSGGGALSLHGDDQVRPGPRTVSARGVILGTAHERQAVLDQWLAASRTRNRLWSQSSADPMFTPTNTVRWAWAWLHPIDPERHYQRPTHDEISLEWTILSPYWHGLYHGNGLDLGTGEMLDDALVLDYAGSVYDTVFSLTASPQNVTLVNNGNAPVVDAVITVRAGNAAITSTSISIGGVAWTFSGTIASGTDLVVDMGGMSVKNNGVDAYAQFTAPTTQLDWFLIPPGSNTVTVTTTGGGTGTSVTFTYFDAWHG